MKTSILLSVENLSSKLFGVANFSALQLATFINSNAKQSLMRLALLMILLLSGAGVVATNYYTYTDGNARDLSKWWTNQNGTGGHPGLTSDFSNAGNVFIIQNNNTMTISSISLSWVVSNLTINAGSALNITSDGALSLEGNFTNHGSLSGTGSTYIFFSGDANQNIDGFTTAGVVSMAKNGGTATFQGNVNGGDLYITGTGGTLNLGAGLTHTFTGSWTRTAGTLEGGSSLLRMEGSAISTSGTFIPGTGTVEWYGSYDQTIAAVTYNNLILSGSGIKSIASGTSVSGNLSIAPTGTATASIAGGVTINTGTLTLGSTGTASGTWGSTASSASHTNNTYFAASTGMVNVATSSCPSFTCTISGTNSICSGSSANLKVIISGGTSPYTVVYSGGTVSNYISGSNIPVSPTSTTSYTLTSVTDATGCVHTGSSADGTAAITVNEAPNITSQPTSPSPVCVGANSSTFIVAASGDGLTYQWQRGISGAYENITGSTIPVDGAVYSGYTTAELTVANAPIAMNGYTYRCVVTGTCPPLVTSDGLATLTINPLPVVSCPQSFSVYLTNQLIPLTGGLPAGGVYSGTGVNSGSFSPTLAGLGAHAITYSYTDVNTCTSSCTFTITVDPLPADYCNGSAYAVIEEYNVSFLQNLINGNFALGPLNGTDAWLESTEYLVLDLTGGRILPSGSTVSVTWHEVYTSASNDPIVQLDISTDLSTWTSTGNFTITGASSSGYVQSFVLSSNARYLKVIHTNLNSHIVAIDGFTYSCESCSAPLISEHPSTSPQILCLNGSATALSVTATGTVLTYQWYSNTTASNSGGSAIEGATASSYTPLTNTTGTLYYYCVVSNACPPSATSNVSGAVTVDPVSVGGTIAGSATVCSGTNTTVLTLSGNTGTVSKWQYNNGGGWTDVDNTTLTLTATDLTATTEYRAVVTSGVCSSANSATATVTVDPVSVGGTIAGSATVCSGTNSTVLTLSGNTGTVSKWQYNNGGGWTDVDNTTFTLTATDLTATTEYRAIVTSGVCSSANSATATVTVESTPVAGAWTKAPDLATVCEGTQVSATLTAGSGGNGTDELEYQTKAGGTWSGWTTYTGTAILTTGKSGVEIRTRRMAEVCDPSSYNTATWEVVPQPTAPSITKSPDVSNVCEGTEVSATFGGGSGEVGCSDTYYYRYDGTGDWIVYSDASPISTTEHSLVEIRAERGGCQAGCSMASNTVSWTVNTAPTFTACPGNIIQNTDANVCTAVVNYTATASGTPTPTVTYSFTGSNPPSPSSGSGTGSGATFKKGVTTVTITASNGCAPDATCSFTVTVADAQAPIITAKADINRTADAAQCSAVVTIVAATATDNCGIDGAVVGTRSDALALTAAYPVGETTITWTVSDIHGNAALPKTQKVTVIDNELPTFTCPADITPATDPGLCSAALTLNPPTASDNCDPNVVVVNSFNNNLVQNGDFNSGDANWENCSNTAEVNTEEYYIVPLPPVSTNHVAEIDDEVSLCQSISGFTVGKEYILTFKATRRQNVSTPNPVSAVVTINGGALSKVVTRTNTTFNLTPVAFKFTATQTTHQLKFTPYTDNDYVLGFIVDDIAITQVNASTITYPIGETQVVWTAIDRYGNASSCTQKVTVTDKEKPVITPATNITQTADAAQCSAVVTIVAATATDNCGIDGAVVGTRSDALALTAAYPVGETTITWTVSDIHGNAALPKTQKVTVIDNELPTFTCPANITPANDPGLCSAVLTIAPPAASDNCDPNVVVVNSFNNNLVQNGDFNSGASHWQDCGNSAESNTEEYYIVPLPPVSTNHVAEIDDGVSLCQNISGFTVGKEYILTFKATRRQNVSTPNPVSAVVTIDGALSKVVTRTNTTFNLTPVAFKFTATQTTHQLKFTPYTDNYYSLGFVVDDIAVTQVNTPSTTYQIGETLVVWTAIDRYGNASSCTQKVTVTDNENPTASSPATINVECFSDIPAPNVAVVTDEADNCGTPVVTFVSDDITSAVCDGDVAKVTRKYKVTDGSTNFIYVYQTINVDDVTPPTVFTKPVTVTLDMNGNASITVAAVNNGTTDNCDGTLDYSLSQSTFTCADVPSKTVTLSATDCAKNTGTNTAVVTINQRATKLVINTLILTGEYSDPVSLKATLTDFATGTKLAGKTVDFQIGTQTATGTTDANGIATASVTLSQAPGVYTLSVSYTGACPYLASSATKPFLILQERACATYTGVLTASTGSVNSSKATLLLSATIVAASDGNSGDIRNALVSFLANGVLIKQLPVGLVTKGNTAVGSAATEYTYDLGTQQGATVTIAVWISGYYRNMLSLDCFDITEVTISKPGTDFITGGGYLLLEPGKHAGTIKADDNSKNNFGFNVKYNKKGTNLQGNINTIVRKTQSDYNADLNVYENVVHKIQIKGTALTSLAISKGINAEFTGKAVAQDVTDPTNVVSLGGNLVMKVLMTDNGEPGSKDLLSMTVFDKDGGVLFSSRWENNQPTKQLLAAGNLQVNPSGLKSIEITAPVSPVSTDELTLKVYPNPFSETLHFEFVSPTNTDALLDILDATGRKVKTIFVGPVEGGVLNNAEFIPAASVTGLYIYRLTMDKKVFVGKVIYKE